MDEPTAALGVQESRAVLELIRSLHRDGVTVVLISHNMDDVIAVTTRVSVLKNGRKIGEIATSGTNADHLAHTITTGVLRPVSM
jgi:simple sugar transport system ATP-binding protein